jgi:hypothetical protein
MRDLKISWANRHLIESLGAMWKSSSKFENESHNAKFIDKKSYFNKTHPPKTVYKVSANFIELHL